MDFAQFIDRVPELSDLELATLLCLVAKQHCIVETEDDLIDDLAAELALIVSEVFALNYVVISAQDISSIDAFGDAILDKYTDISTEPGQFEPENDANYADSTFQALGLQSRLSAVNFQSSSTRKLSDIRFDTRKVVNVVIAKDFNLAHEDVQVQALELIKSRRIYSRTTMHPAPDAFLFLPLIPSSSRDIRLNKHLENDRIFISHYHDPEDGFSNLEELDDSTSTGPDSASSIKRPSSRLPDGDRTPLKIPVLIIDTLRNLGEKATMTPEVRRYLQDLVIFFRLERGVAEGVSPYATVSFVALAKYLAPLHGLDFVTPSLVALAARKIYPHRILIAPAENERSMRYGSDLEAVRDLLLGVTPESVIEAVLNTVECPL